MRDETFAQEPPHSEGRVAPVPPAPTADAPLAEPPPPPPLPQVKGDPCARLIRSCKRGGYVMKGHVKRRGLYGDCYSNLVEDKNVPGVMPDLRDVIACKQQITERTNRKYCEKIFKGCVKAKSRRAKGKALIELARGCYERELSATSSKHRIANNHTVELCKNSRLRFDEILGDRTSLR